MSDFLRFLTKAYVPGGLRHSVSVHEDRSLPQRQKERKLDLLGATTGLCGEQSRVPTLQLSPRPSESWDVALHGRQ